MKSMIRGALALALVAAGTPAFAGKTPTTYATWEDCLAVAAAAPSPVWEAYCVQNSEGRWQIFHNKVMKKSSSSR